jgi:hypothetical protein
MWNSVFIENGAQKCTLKLLATWSPVIHSLKICLLQNVCRGYWKTWILYIETGEGYSFSVVMILKLIKLTLAVYSLVTWVHHVLCGVSSELYNLLRHEKLCVSLLSCWYFIFILFLYLLHRGYTRSVRKVSDRIFLCEHLMDYNLARLHEPTLNLSAHAW